jgi:hypothetical protein
MCETGTIVHTAFVFFLVYFVLVWFCFFIFPYVIFLLMESLNELGGCRVIYILHIFKKLYGHEDY